MFILTILLGIVACAVPFWGINRLVAGKTDNLLPYALDSFGCCLLAFLLMFAEIRSKVNAGDWAGLGDTMGVFFVIAIALMVLTLLINLFGYILSRMKR